MEQISSSSEQTKQIAADFAKTLKGGEVIFLQGELGSGKTTFVQGLVESFGFSDPVRSPTFTLMNIYKIDHAQIDQMIHFDFYRIEDSSEVKSFGLEEYLHDPKNIVLIEWPEKGLDVKMGLKNVRIQFTIASELMRKINIEYGKG